MCPFLLLAGPCLCSWWSSLPVWLLYTAIGLSQGFYFFVLTRPPRMIKEVFPTSLFQPSNLPTVITATRNGPRLTGKVPLRPLVRRKPFQPFLCSYGGLYDLQKRVEESLIIATISWYLNVRKLDGCLDLFLSTF